MKNLVLKLLISILFIAAYGCCFFSIYLSFSDPDPYWQITLALIAATILHFVMHFFSR